MVWNCGRQLITRVLTTVPVGKSTSVDLSDTILISVEFAAHAILNIYHVLDYMRVYRYFNGRMEILILIRIISYVTVAMRARDQVLPLPPSVRFGLVCLHTYTNNN